MVEEIILVNEDINQNEDENVDFDVVNEASEVLLERPVEVECEQNLQKHDDDKDYCEKEDVCQNDEVVSYLESQNVTLDSVMISLNEMNDKIEQMNNLFVQKIQHTTHEEKIVDQMHAELQKYKDDMYSQLVRPILLDIIEIRDSIIRMSKAFEMKPEGEQDVPLKTFSDYSYDIQDVLEKNNITIYNSKEGDEFVALKHRVVKKVTTSDEEMHGKISESLSSGYDYMGRTISPEKVVVYIYEKTIDEEGE